MIKHVVFMPNGMVAAFDEKGEQVPEGQGFILEVGERLQNLCNNDTRFGFAVPGFGEVKMDVEWWFFNRRGTPAGMP